MSSASVRKSAGILSMKGSDQKGSNHAYLALACFLPLAAPAFAQNTPATPAASGEPALLGRVTVTDTALDDSLKTDHVQSPKFTQPIADTPQTIQVIPRELFQQQAATTLTEALRNSPGVGTFYAGENGNTATGDSISMRGFDTSNSIFVDGVRDLGAMSRDLFNVEQVEVFKGPAGTDNGRTAPTGAINLVTKEAGLDNALSGSATIGVDGQKRGTIDVNQRIDALPNAALRLNAVWEDSDVPGRDHVNNKRVGVAPSFGVGIDTPTRVFLDLLYVKQDNIPDGFVPTIGLPGWVPQPGLEQLAGHPVRPENFYGTRSDHDDGSAEMATLRVEHDVSPSIRLRNTARFGRTRQHYLLTSFMTTGGTTADPMAGNIHWTDANDLSTYSVARSLPTMRDQENRILTDQLSLNADFHTGAVAHSLSLGAEITGERQILWGEALSGAMPRANLYAPDWNDRGTFGVARSGAVARGETNTQSAYLFDTAKFFEDILLVTAGVRVDHYKTSYFSTAVCNNGSGRGAVSCGAAPVGTIVTTTDLDTDKTLFNWKLGAVVKPVPDVSLYVNYALSQQPPGGSNFTLSAAATSADNPALQPQKAKTIEAGIKWNALQEALLVQASVFQTTIDNEINNQILDDFGNPTQTGKKRVKGIELSAVGNLTRDWSLSAGYSHLNTRVVEGPLVTSDGTPNLTYTPGDSFTLWTNYRLPFGFEVAGGLRYNGGLHRGTDGAVGTPTGTSGYTLADAMLAYAVTDNLKLRVNAQNLFDKRYVVAINKSGYRYTPGTPRTFLFSADFRF